MLKKFSPLAINSPVESLASSSPISTCMGAAPPSPIPRKTRENVVTCQLLTCGQINFRQKGVSWSLLVLMFWQPCRYRYVPGPINDQQKCRSRYRYTGPQYVQPWSLWLHTLAHELMTPQNTPGSHARAWFTSDALSNLKIHTSGYTPCQKGPHDRTAPNIRE